MGLPHWHLWCAWLIFKMGLLSNKNFLQRKGKETSTFYRGKFFWGNSRVLSKWALWLETRFVKQVHGVWWHTNTLVPEDLSKHEELTVSSASRQKLLRSGARGKTPLALQCHLKTQGKRRRSCAQSCPKHEQLECWLVHRRTRQKDG